MVKFTSKDFDLLYELSIDARASLTSLAKKTNLSKQVVSYRLKRLEEENILLGYHAVVNVFLTGKTDYRVFVKFRNLNAEIEKELVDFLSKEEKVTWLAHFDGEYDLGFVVWAENVLEFEQVYLKINHVYGKYFQKKYFSISTRIDYLKYKFLTKRKNYDSLVFGDCYGNTILDELDYNLILELNRNARISLVDLSMKYNLSAKAIKDRIDNLVRKKVLLGFTIKINHNKLGFTHRKILLKLNDLSFKEMNRLTAYLKDHEAVIYLTRSIGEFDFEFEIMTNTNEAYFSFLSDLRNKFANSISEYSSLIHVSEIKSGELKV